jgi:hypothetical protein
MVAQTARLCDPFVALLDVWGLTVQITNLRFVEK